MVGGTSLLTAGVLTNRVNPEAGEEREAVFDLLHPDRMMQREC